MGPVLPRYAHNMHITDITVLSKFLSSLPIPANTKRGHYQSISFGNNISIAVRVA